MLREEQKKYGGLFKGLKLLAMFLNPIAGATVSGLTAGAESTRKKKALKQYKGRLGDLSKHLGDTRVDFGSGWGGRTRGLSWLSDPTRRTQTAIDRYMKTGSKQFLESSKEIGKMAGKINPLMNALMTGVSSWATKELGGQEGVFGDKTKDLVYTPGEMGAMPTDTIYGKTPYKLGTEGVFTGSKSLSFGDKLQQQFLGDPDKGGLLEGKGDISARVLELLPMFADIFMKDEGLGLPEIDTDSMGYVSQYGRY